MKQAVVCRPAPSVVNSLGMNSLGEVNFLKLQRQHDKVCSALVGLGFSLECIPFQEKYPDSVFLEDPAVILEGEGRDHAYVMSYLRNEKRQGEEISLMNFFSPKFFKKIEVISVPGYLEGGDTLVCPEIKKLFIGISERTNQEGADQLARLACDRHGYSVTMIEIPKNLLHLKEEATFHSRKKGKHIISVSEEICDHFAKANCKLIVTPARERFAANAISNGDKLLMKSGAPKTQRLFEKSGYEVSTVNISEFMKIGGALTRLWNKIPENI